MKRSKNLQLATEAAMTLNPKFIKYYKGMLTIKLHYCKFYIFDCCDKEALIFQYINNANLHRGNLELWYERMAEYRYNAYIERKKYDGDMFVLRDEFDIFPFTTLEDVAYQIFEFSRELNHSIDLAHGCSISVVNHI